MGTRTAKAKLEKYGQLAHSNSENGIRFQSVGISMYLTINSVPPAPGGILPRAMSIIKTSNSKINKSNALGNVFVSLLVILQKSSLPSVYLLMFTSIRIL